MGLAHTENNVFALPEEGLFIKSRPFYGQASSSREAEKGNLKINVVAFGKNGGEKIEVYRYTLSSCI